MFKVVKLVMGQDKEGRIYVNKFIETSEDEAIASVYFNIASDENSPVYMLKDDERIAFCNPNNILPLYNWVNGKASIEEMIVWRQSFTKDIVSYTIVTAIQCLDLEIAKHVPSSGLKEREEVHTIGLPSKQKEYSKYQIEYIDGENTKSKIFTDRHQAIEAYKKIVGKRPVKVYGLDSDGKHLLKET